MQWLEIGLTSLGSGVISGVVALVVAGRKILHERKESEKERVFRVEQMITERSTEAVSECYQLLRELSVESETYRNRGFVQPERFFEVASMIPAQGYRNIVFLPAGMGEKVKIALTCARFIVNNPRVDDQVKWDEKEKRFQEALRLLEETLVSHVASYNLLDKQK